MSLPQAKKEISTHPGKNAVTDPSNAATMQADVDRKLRLYGVIEAFRQGRLPDNQQIDETLRYVEKTSPIDTSKLSPAGNKLIADTRDIIETARLIVQEKNADELFQNFIYHTAGTDTSRVKPDNVADAAPVDKAEAKADGQQAVQHLRTLLSILLTNSEARKLLSDVSLIGRDLFARGVVHGAEKIRPPQDQLSRVDDAAPQEQFVGPDGQNHGTDRLPPVKVGPFIHDPNAPGGARDNTHMVTGDGQTRPVNDVANDARNVAQDVKNEAQNEAGAHADDMQRRVDAAETDEEKKEVAKSGFREKLSNLRDRIPQEHKDKAGAQVDKAKDFLNDEFPEERREQFIYRLKKVIVECQKHSDYQTSLTWFIGMLEKYFQHARTIGKVGQEHGSQITDDPALQHATSELRTLLERFANGKSLDGIIHAAQRLSDDAQNDEGLRKWFDELDAYVRKTLLEPGFVLSPQCNNEANRLIDTGRTFFDEKYKGHKDALFDETQAWFVAFGDDPLNKRFGEDWARLTKDVLFDENGSLTFKPQLWNDIRKVILPELVDQVGYIPIPRVEYTDNQLDLVIENLTLQGRNLFPNTVEIEAHNHVVISPYSAIPDKHNHNLTLTFSQIQADMRDVAFYFKKKTGIPKIQDSGLADVFLGGEGLTVKVHLASAGKDKSSVFHVKDVSVKVDSLKFSVRDSKHDLLYKTLRPLATGLVKKQISRAIQDSIRTGLEYVDGQLVQVRDRMAEAQADDNTSRTQVLKNMFERKQDEAASKKESVKKSDAHFKVVAKRDSVILPQGHESGWINKQAEREAAANQGEGWKSKAFSIINPERTSISTLGSNNTTSNTTGTGPRTAGPTTATGAAPPRV